MDPNEKLQDCLNRLEEVSEHIDNVFGRIPAVNALYGIAQELEDAIYKIEKLKNPKGD